MLAAGMLCSLFALLCPASVHAAPGTGTASIIPSFAVGAGSEGTWIIRYTAAEPFSSGTLRVNIPVMWTSPQDGDPSSSGYVTVSSTGTLPAAPISISGRNITISVDTLSASDTVDVVYGDTTVSQSGRAVAQQTAESGVTFATYSDPAGTSPAAISLSPSVDVVALAVSSLVFDTPERTLAADGESDVMRIRSEDEFGNPSPVTSDRTVSLVSSSPTGRFSALPGAGWAETASVIMLAGEDTVSFYYRDTSTGIFDITASAVGQSWTDAAQQVTVVAGTPARLVVSPEDTVVTAGEYARYTIEVTDIHGNPSPVAASQVITLLGSSFYDKDDHSATIPSVTVPAGESSVQVDFMNTFKDLTDGYILAFLDIDGSPPSLEAASTDVFVDHAAADPSVTSLELDKATVTADGSDQAVATVTVMDQYGNTVDGETVSLTMSGDGNTVTPLSGPTGPDGLASWTLRSTFAESKTVSASIGSGPVTDTEPVTFVAGPADMAVSTISASPDTVEAGGASISTVTVTVLDADGNPVPGAVVTLFATPGPNTITQPAVTGPSGVATGTIASTEAGTKTVSATINGQDLSSTYDVVFIPGDVDLSLSSLSVDRTTVTADGADSVTVTVTVRDSSGNPVPGAGVVLTATGSENDITPPGLTGADGTATGSVRSTLAEAKTIGAEFDGNPFLDTEPVTFVAGPADMAVSTISASPDTVEAGGASISTVTVTVLDADGNPVPGAVVTLFATPGPNTITQPAVTGPSGVATGTIASTEAGTKTVSATINGQDLSSTYDVVFIPGDVDLSLSSLSVDRTTVTADGADSVTVTVTVRDSSGNPVEGVTVDLTVIGSSYVITPPVGGTDSEGIATGFVRSTLAESKTIGAEIPGTGTLLDTEVVTFVAGPADTSVSQISAAPATVVADGTSLSVVTVTVLDAEGNPVPGAVVTLDAIGAGVDVNQPTGVTGGTGEATGSISSTGAGTKTVSAAIDGRDLLATDQVVFIAGAPDAFVISHDGSAVAGISDNVTIEVLDRYGNTVEWFDGEVDVYTDTSEPTDLIDWGTGGTGNIIGETGDRVTYDFAPTDGGSVTLTFTDRRAETVYFTAEYGAVVSTSSFPMTVQHGPADSIFAVSGDGQTAVVATEVPADLVVGVEDEWGNRVAGANVIFTVLAGGGTVDTDPAAPGLQSTATTGSGGEASCGTWILGTTSGQDSDEVEAAITSGTTRAVYFNATAEHDEVSSIVLTPSGTVSVPVNSSPVVTATFTDTHGNLVTGENLTVFIKDAADGTLSADPSNPNPTSELSPVMRSGTSDSTGTVTVVYNAPASAGVQDVIDGDNVTVGAGSIADVTYTTTASLATKLLVADIAGLPARAGEPFSFEIRATDDNDNRDPSNASIVYLSPDAGGGLEFSLTSDFASTITQTQLVNGSAVIYGRGTGAGSWSVGVSSTGPLLDPASFEAEIAASTDVHHYDISATSPPAAGEDFTVSLLARDQWGNLVETAFYDIDMRAVDPVDTTLPAPDVLSITGGRIEAGSFTEDNLSYETAGQIRVEVSDDSTSVVGVSPVIDVPPAGAYQLAELQGDTTGVAAGDSVLLRVQVTDIFGNPVPGVTVSFGVLAGGGGLAAEQRITGADGTASVSYGTGTAAGTNIVRAAILDGKPEGLETREFVITTVPASGIDYVILSTAVSSAVAGEPIDCHAAAYDANDNLITSDSSTRLLPVDENGTMGFVPDTLTLSAGEAGFTATDIAAGTNRIRIESLAGADLSGWSGPLSIDHAPAWGISEVSGDTTGVISGDTAQVTVRVRDVYGNPAGGQTVYFDITSDLGGAPSLIDPDGSPGDGITVSRPDGTATCLVVTDTNAGENTVTATILDGDPPDRERVEFSIATVAGTISRYTIIPDSWAQTAGQPFGVTITAYDLNDNIASGDFSTVVDLSSDGTAVFSQEPVTLSAGTASVDVTEEAAGTLVLFAETSGGGAFSQSGDIEVLPDSPAGAIAIQAVSPDTITANGVSTSLISTQPVTDQFGNIVPPGTKVTVTPSDGFVRSDDIDETEPGFQRQTGLGGEVLVFIGSSATPGDVNVLFESVEGSATGAAGLVFAPVPGVVWGGDVDPRYLAPGDTVSFSVTVANTSSTGLTLSTGTVLEFSDAAGSRFSAGLAEPLFLGGSSSGTLVFGEATLPSTFYAGTYSPKILVTGTDQYGSPYTTQFDAGVNSLTVTSIEITGVAPRMNLVSRGDTVIVDVDLRNTGGETVIVREITLDFDLGTYEILEGASSPLPDTLPAGLVERYSKVVRVSPSSPVGTANVDAAARATANGSNIYDYSAVPNTGRLTIQSAATLAYDGGTLDPVTVSRGQRHSFSLGLSNSGDAAVILEPGVTTLSFTDGTETYSAALAAGDALPGGTTTEIVFPEAQVPAGMAAGGYGVTVDLRGTENGAAFDTSLVLSDPVAVVDPASLAYLPGTLAPSTVSKGSTVSFETGIGNSGGATVECDPSRSFMVITDGALTYYAYLDEERELLIRPGDNTIYFESKIMPTGFSSGSFTPSVHIEGLENGKPFGSDPAVTDEISVQDPSQIAITSIDILPTSRFTADQTTPRFARIRAENNGEAPVRLDSLDVRLFEGGSPVTGEYLLSHVDFTAGEEIAGGAQDSFVVMVSDDPSVAMTTGTVVVEATLWGTDLNSLVELVASTEYGGKGSFLVQTPADVGVRRVLASEQTVTTGQARDWTVDVAVENLGESDVEIDLDPDSTFVTFSTPGDFTVVHPVELAGGGTILEGGSVDTMRFTVDQTGSEAGTCTVNCEISSTEINSGRPLPAAKASPSAAATVEVQTPGVLEITGITPSRDPVTVGQAGVWDITVSVSNTGGSDLELDLLDADSSSVWIVGGSGFAMTGPSGLEGGGTVLAAGESGNLVFQVTATGTAEPGEREIGAELISTETNSGRRVYGTVTGPAGVNSVTFELLPVPLYAASSLNPVAVSSGTSVGIRLGIYSADTDEADLVLDREATFAWIGDADGDTMRAWLSPVSENVLEGGSQAALIFNSVPVSPELQRQGYTVNVHLGGTENGNDFEADMDSSPDLLTVEDAPQLSITGILTPQSVTAGVQPLWKTRMVLHNTGEASVELDLDPASTNITFTISGAGDRTGEYTIVQPAGLAGAGGLILAGNQVDTLVFDVAGTGTTTGTALVNGTVSAVDVNSGGTVTDDTYTGGGSYLAVQEPALPAIVATTLSRETITSGQTTPWTASLTVRNEGEALMTLVPDSTYIYADDGLTVPAPPSSFAEGGSALAGGESGTLVFEVTPSPDTGGGYDLRIDSRAGFVEDNRGQYLYSDTGEQGSGFASVRVQAPALLRIDSLVSMAPRPGFVNDGQTFPLTVELANLGEAAADLVGIVLVGDGSSVITNSPLQTGEVEGGSSVTDTFLVTAAGAGSAEEFIASITGATDVNSGQADLYSAGSPVDDTETVSIQQPGSLEIAAVTPSQDEVNAGQTADWRIRIDLVNTGGGPVALAAPAAPDISFELEGSPLTDYLVLPPQGLASGAPDLTLDGGGADSLVYVVSSTGIDTGTVDIVSELAWTDGNDPGSGASYSAGSSTVYVKEPSGLRIISITSDAPNNSLFPNTSIVNVNQVFNLTVTVENTGGDDLRDVEVEVISNGNADITPVSFSPDLPSGSEGEFVFEVSSAIPAIEVLSASIVGAVSVNTGEQVPPIQALESIENLQVQVPAILSVTAGVISPAGAVDDTVSTGQDFVLESVVENQGGAGIDDMGRVTLDLPAGYALAYPDADSLSRSFVTGAPVRWTVRAPSSQSGPDDLSVSISRIPADINTGSSANVQTGTATVTIETEAAAGMEGCTLAVASPSGALDGVLSTGQSMVLRAALTPSANSGSNTVTISLPDGFDAVEEKVRQLGEGDGSEIEVDWTVTAPDVPAAGEVIGISTGGTDLNSGTEFTGCGASLQLDVVERSMLSLDAFISGPPEALQGNLSVNLPFTIEAEVSNSGTAGIDTSGARLELVLPADADYRLDGPSESLRKGFFPGEPVSWSLRAPLEAAPPRIIRVRFAQPPPLDENSRTAAEIISGEVPIGVTTEAGTITMQNITGQDTIFPYVVPQGAVDVPVLKVVFNNNSEYTAGLDTIFFNVRDEMGRDRSYSSDYVSAITMRSGRGDLSWTAQAGAENPVPMIVAHGYTIEPGRSDTALVSIDVSPGARQGQIRIEIASSDRVVFSIGEDRSPIRVVRDATGDDIAGFFYNLPLQVMSTDFEEYVHNYPNPFRAGSESTSIAYFLTRDSAVSIKIFDYTGELVWTREIPSGGPGGTGEPEGTWWEVEWDGRNGSGEVVRNGVYVCTVKAGGNSAIFKIAVAK